MCGEQANTPAEWLDGDKATCDGRCCTDCAELPRVLAQADALWVRGEAGPALLGGVRQANLWDDWLTIRQDAQGQDHLTVSTRHDITPLSLFPEWAQCTQEQTCFPVS